jgi:hypothetical protein
MTFRQGVTVLVLHNKLDMVPLVRRALRTRGVNDKAA